MLVSELARWNQRVNLTAIRNPDDMVSGHVLDSLAAAPFLRGTTVLDVGTGAGFPGLPLAIAMPARQFTLLDSNGKKIRFVQHMIGELGLKNVNTVQARAERYTLPMRFDTVIARAFAALPRILALAGHLVAETGVLLALKGKDPHAEIRELGAPGDSWDCTVTRLTVPGMEDHERHAVCLSRRGTVRA
ncbi:MAG: 16S rRNA (guanine(527)-N(7))-methyltransferase RsmG [Woeseia sp.]|nr:16S rRNA (guanine(527)-N(7))-methyltransferase RsmG [Woeseia sp.]MBT8096598.1 16S rRNA (guanine(527)-N(7))-methyltransferase RsmG [Woeseia sp.]